MRLTSPIRFVILAGWTRCATPVQSSSSAPQKSSTTWSLTSPAWANGVPFARPVGGTKVADRTSVPSSLDATSARSERGRRVRKFSRQTAAASSPGRWFSHRPAPLGFSFVAVDGGTEVTETWELPPEGSAFFERLFGDDAAKEIGIRSDGAKSGIEATLAAIKGAAEA